MLPKDDHDQACLARRRQYELGKLSLWIISPEDLVIHKLKAWRAQDFIDVLSVLQLQAESLDRSYITNWVSDSEFWKSGNTFRVRLMPQCPEQQTVPDTVLFHTIPQNLSPLLHLPSPNRPYVVRGLVEESFGVTTLTVHDLQPLESPMDNECQQRARYEYSVD